MNRHIDNAMRKVGARSLGGDSYNIPIPPDEFGMVGRQCTRKDCSPRYFKIKTGTGITENHNEAFCPYCRTADEPAAFFTEEQKRYAVDQITQAAGQAAARMLEDAIGGRQKRHDAGLFSITMSIQAPKPMPVRRPLEEELRRGLTCPKCGLEHAVFGLAFWCPDCGADIFVEHVRAEFKVVETMLGDVERRRETLGPRIGARDIENCLEDTVSIFEAVMKIIVRRKLEEDGQSEEEIEKTLKKMGNAFQNPDRAAAEATTHLSLDLWGCLNADELDFIKSTFEKRHPITHNLGVVDRKYLAKAMSLEKEGREVRVTEGEVSRFMGVCATVVETAWQSLPPWKVNSEHPEARYECDSGETLK